MKTRILGSLLLWSALAGAVDNNARPWPFDQRNILLSKGEKDNFPDELTMAQLMDIFVKKGRVRWVSQKAGPGQIVPVEVPRDFQWQSASAVRQLGLRYKVDGILQLSQRGVQIDMNWYSTLDGLPLFFESVSLPVANSAADKEARKKRLQDWLAEIWSRIPGQGYVVKRDFSTLSLEGGAQGEIKAGQKLEIRRLVQIERHPLLKTLVKIKSSVTGVATLSSIGDPMSVAKIEYESKTDPIQEGDRYIVVTAKSETTGVPSALLEKNATDAPKEVVEADGRVALPFFGSEPEKKDESTTATSGILSSHVADVAAEVNISSLSFEEAISEQNLSMSAKSPGFALRGRVYVTNEWLALADFGMSFHSFGSLSGAYGAGSISSTMTNFGISGAYRFVFLEDPSFPGELTVGLGYRKWSLTMSQISSDFAPTSKSYSGFDLAFGVQVPVVEQWALSLKASRLIAAALGEDPKTSGSVVSNNLMWQFGLGAKYRLSSVADIGGVYRILAASSNFEGSGTRTTPATSSQLRANTFALEYSQIF